MEYLNAISSNEDSSSTQLNTNYKKNDNTISDFTKAYKALTHFFVCCRISFSVVDSPFFHDFVKNLYFEYELPKQTILLTTYLNAETANIKRRIASSKEFNFGPLGQSIYAFIIITPTQSQYIYSIDDFLSQRKDKFIAVVSDVEAAMQSVKRKAKTILQKCQKIVTFFHDEYRAEDALYKKIKKNNIKLILSHNGIIGNDIADKLAKKGQCGNNLFRNNTGKLLGLSSIIARDFTVLACDLTIYEPLFIAKLFHKILPLGSILAIRKPRLYKEMKCIMKCNKKENWNHLFECEDFIRRVLQNILEVTAKSEKFQKFQQLALEVKVENFLTTKLQKDFKISLTEAQTLMANILIRFILAFKELIWKSKCEQVIL
ncbi:hypothetical protein GLOIN_2v1790055 [Rhizophagus irregularis DAOM 181602=DAOM 197198]|uniref:Uncharacterized protein n=1 Tax=Rhizophagus irregularis (strain DAOM 181602 / DAOM 197198 / MUCL 43194) TaxID=747089 RepID=A0A2P4NZX9_RHIID|nr:hypothetical protein GLOIN_2v1790055 [Rhizophagus irregularis DAOM 181602=DAOM 197198]POG58674.1 hypothetical protein GLOIN_2v1790055 [Rhizophagus irregularis DAOM 181602=DAOM 197198]|eukprot:XP_025165540.1 hypothetical protein GLOIN_2v1790055 [Rhizophagus irregularis DAOM 181602=DAOM 197198]